MMIDEPNTSVPHSDVHHESNPVVKFINTVAYSLFGAIGAIVRIASDEAAEIAIRALPLVSPMPNAIGLFFTAKTTLGFGDWQAASFALSAELALFGMVDVLLRTFDGYLLDKLRYRIPLMAAVSCAAVMLAIIIGVVIKLEVAHPGGNPVLAALPLISAVGAVALAIRRWDKNQISAYRTKLQAELSTANRATERLTSELAELQAKLQTEQVSRTGLAATANREAEALRVQVASLTERVTYWRTEAERRTAPSTVNEPEKATRSGNLTDRRLAVLRAAAQTEKKSQMNFAELGREHGVSDVMIGKDLKWLIDNGYWLNGDTWKPTPAGVEWAGLAVSEN